MRIRLKLSVPHDMDLITLTQCQFPMSEWIKITLKSYVEEKRLTAVPLPEMPMNIRYAKGEINFSLHETRDKAVIAWLNTLRKGQRTGAVKSIFRCSLSAPCLAGHAINASAAIKIPAKETSSVTHSFAQAVPRADFSSKPKKKPAPPPLPKPVIQEDDDFDIFGFNPDR